MLRPEGITELHLKGKARHKAMDEGFYIEGLSDFENKLLKAAKREVPQIVQNILETLGEILINEAKDVLQGDVRPHARYAMKTKVVTRGKNKGKARNYLQFKGTASANAVDTGRLWNSLSRGASGNIWTFSGGTGKFTLCVGSSVKYAKYINDGYTASRHWVPGVIDGKGKFIYQKGAKTGIMVSTHTYKGVKYFDIGFEEMKKEAPEVVRYELDKFAEVFNNG